MKRIVIVISILWMNAAAGQVSIGLNLPPQGLTMKSQLWNMMVTNSSSQNMLTYLELRMSDATSNVQVMTARTISWNLAPGAQVLQANLLAPIQYNVIDPAYQAFAVSEFLPVGSFQVCFSLWKQESDRVEKIVEECNIVTIEPLSPPLLLSPDHQSELENGFPLFTWTAPAPVQLFTGMTYDLQVAEILPGQTENDAIQQNIPLFNQSGITSTSYPYPAGAPSLELEKRYAWRVSVRNAQNIVAQTDTWWFTIRNPNKIINSSTITAFLKLKKSQDQAYGLALNELKFEYLNETGDSVWEVQLSDISKERKLVGEFSMDSIPLRFGQNLVRLGTNQLEFLEDKHMYLLELRNSRREIYRLKFEYRRKEINNNK